MSPLQFHQFPCLSDNYGVLVHDAATGATASIDAPEAEAVRTALTKTGWRLTHILVTHHHADHTQGIAVLKAETKCHVVGPRGEAAKIAGLDATVGGGDTFDFAGSEVRVLDTPGHTLGHITYWLPEAKVAFVGDTVFAMGCGRVIEGTYDMMWTSLERVMALPADTMLYCGHEYTLANGRFALGIDPENAVLRSRLAECEAMRARGEPTLPTRLDTELATNPFLRAGDAAVQRHLGMVGQPTAAVFAEIRERKNKS